MNAFLLLVRHFFGRFFDNDIVAQDSDMRTNVVQALGLTLLVAFSLGLAIVLMSIGLVVLYAKHLLPDGENTARNPFFRYVPVASAGIITCAGLLMTGVALGVIRPFAGV
jgi:hypothetical protein